MNRALWHVSPTHSELRPVKPPLNIDLMAVDSLYSLISTGTERLVACAETGVGIGMAIPGMRGDFELPIKYGYSLVGLDLEERLVHCMHPHQSTAYVAKSDLYRPTSIVTPRRLTLLSNLETVLNAIWDAEIGAGQDILVCGFGNVGALLAQTLLVSEGIGPVVAETDQWRLFKARDLGFEAFHPAELTTSFSLIFHTSCTESGLQFCIERAGLEATIVELSWYGAGTVGVRLGGNFHRNRVRLVSSQVSAIPVRMRDAIDFSMRKAMAADLLTDDRYDNLITNEIAFEESAEFFNLLRTGQQGDGLIWLIRY